MPIGPLAAAGIGLAGGLLDSGANALFAGAANRRQMNFAREMYGRQRQDALADWHMQNQYNSPMEQMSRLKAAGLNPNLVYGSGANAMSQGQVRSADAGSYNPQVPRVSLNAGEAMAQYQDVRVKNEQVKNLQEINKQIIADTALKYVQAGNITANTARSQFDLKLAEDLRSIGIQKAQADRDAVIFGNQVLLNRDKREQAHLGIELSDLELRKVLNSATIGKMAEEVLMIAASRANTYEERKILQEKAKEATYDRRIKRWEWVLSTQGLTKSDPVILRQVREFVEKAKAEGGAVKRYRNWADSTNKKIDSINKRWFDYKR